MSIKDNIVTKLSQVIDKYSFNQLEIVQNIIDNKLDKLVEQQVLKDEAKQLYIETLETIIDDFIQKNKNIYWYNKGNDTYYMYLDNRIKSINSDTIIIKITNMIPEEYYKNKNGFRRHLLHKIQSMNFIDEINLNHETILNCKTILKPFLKNENDIEYILTTIGYSIYSNNKHFKDDKDDNTTDIFYNNTTHLWYGGQIVNDFLEAIKFWIYDLIKVYPKFLSKIKTTYNNYNIEQLHIIRFNNIDSNTLDELFKIIKFYKMELILTSIHYYKLYYLNHISIKNNAFKNKLDIFNEYKTNMIIDSSFGSLKIRDIMTSLSKYLDQLDIPENLFTYNELKEYMDNYYSKNIEHKNSHIYKNISLKNNSLDVIFVEYSDDNIHLSNNNTIRFSELYYFFKIWLSKYYPDMSCPNKTDIKNIMDNYYINNLDEKNQIYLNLTLTIYNKTEIFSKFIEENILNEEENSYIKLDDLYVIFTKWFQDTYDNLPLIHKDDIKELMNNLYSDAYKKYKGWNNLKILQQLTNKDKNDIIENIKESSIHQ